MIKNIQYTGYATEPSDYECPDGQLAMSLNLLSEDNRLKPLFQPKTIMQFPDKSEVLHIHKTSVFEHYIYLWFNDDTSDYELWYYDIRGNHKEKIMILVDVEGIGVNSIGNTIVVVCSDVWYSMWNGTEYTCLGNHLPTVNLSFGLQGHPRLFSKTDSGKAQFTVSFDEMNVSDMLGEFPDTQKNQITEQIMAKVNKFIAQQSVNKGRFSLPFLVRYGLRLYDGSVVMHSAPVLMNPCTNNNPVVYWTEAYSDDSSERVSHATCDMMLLACDLDYAFNIATSDGNLTDWKDIVKSVDVFISKPLYPYDQNGKISSCKNISDFDSVFIGSLCSTGQSSTVEEDKVVSPVTGVEFLSKYYSQWKYSHIYAMYFTEDRRIPWSAFRLPEYSEEKIEKGIKDCGTFYLLHSIKLTELNSERKVIPIEDDFLQSLVAREVMTDDYQTHDKIIPKYTFCYNNRMNFANVRRELFKGFQMSAMLSFCNTRINFELDGTTVQLSRPTVNWSHLTDRYSVIVYIKHNGEEKQVCCNGNYDSMLCNFLTDDGNSQDTGESWGCYFFYPDANAYKMKIVPLGYNAATQAGKSYDINLVPHDFMNGAYALIHYGLKRYSTENHYGSTDNKTDILSFPNKIYTSQVNNPFFFHVLGINTVGTGNIVGISAAAKALSEGQFGQFPLYAFTSDGVWALEVSDSGTYSAKQPVTRDVCINPYSITQLDNAVLFATARGLMLIQGSQTTCITDSISSEATFNVMELKCIEQLHSKLGHDADMPVKPFLGFLTNSRMIYDYVHQRIILFNPTVNSGERKYTYAYVFSLKSKQWGMMFSNLKSAINSYPDALAMTHDNKLVSFSDTDETLCRGMYITRPVKLDAPDIYKSVSSVIQRGYFERGDVATVLYASRDLFNWYLVWSSKDHYLRGIRGIGYKYFRIAGIASLTEGKSVFGASFDFVSRHTNQLR